MIYCYRNSTHKCYPFQFAGNHCADKRTITTSIQLPLPRLTLRTGPRGSPSLFELGLALKNHTFETPCHTVIVPTKVGGRLQPFQGLLGFGPAKAKMQKPQKRFFETNIVALLGHFWKAPPRSAIHLPLRYCDQIGSQCVCVVLLVSKLPFLFRKQKRRITCRQICKASENSHFV
jgi:hypothetical protein